MLAHRHAYEQHHGVTLSPRGEPDHQQVDHECHNRSKSCKGGRDCRHRRCVNPAHLCLKSPRDNSDASAHTVAHQNRRKTHCPDGHEYTPGNTYTYVHSKDGGTRRACRACRANTDRKRKEARRRRK